VYVAAIRNRKQQLPEDPDELYEISRSKASPDMEFLSHRDRPFRLTLTTVLVSLKKLLLAGRGRH
jgi:peptide/histidine transporter 3/4